MFESSQPEEKQYLRETHSDSLRGDPLITEDVSLLLKGKTFFYVFTDTSVQKGKLQDSPAMSSTPVQRPNYYTKLESTTTT